LTGFFAPLEPSGLLLVVNRVSKGEMGNAPAAGMDMAPPA
jgi:hypothetical protein